MVLVLVLARSLSLTWHRYSSRYQKMRRYLEDNAEPGEVAPTVLANVHFLTAQFNASVDSLLGAIPSDVRLARITILHPDPWFKKKQRKRRYGRHVVCAGVLWVVTFVATPPGSSTASS